MRKVLIVRLCAAVGLCTSAVSLAQFVPSPPTQPQVHLWEPPKTEIPLRDQFGPMVRILICNPNATPQQVVDGGIAPEQIDLQGGLGLGCGNPPNYTVSNIMQRWADPDSDPSTTWNWIGAGRTSIFLQNAKNADHRATSLTGKEGFADERDREKLDVDVTVPNDGFRDGPFSDLNVSDENILRNVPYMLAGREMAADFWSQVATEIVELQNTYPSITMPSRVHLDIEPQALVDRSLIPDENRSWTDLRLADAFNPESAFMLYALPLEDSGYKPVKINGVWQHEATTSTFSTADNRWHNVPVPGFGGKTMATLWNEVKANFGNRPYPLISSSLLGPRNYSQLEPTAFAPAQEPWSSDFTNNRGVFMWWSSITSRALAAIHTETAINNMKESFPDMLGSNYDMSYISPGSQDFGWHEQVARPPGQPSTTVLRRVGKRGLADSSKHGSNTQRTDLATVLNQGGTALGLDWLNYQTLDKAGDFSSPVLYALGKAEYVNDLPPLSKTWEQYYQKDVYRPTHPSEDRWLASLRWHRWQLESIVSSEGERAGGQPWTLIAPWVPVPDGEAQIFNPFSLNDNSGPCDLPEQPGYPSNGCYNPSAYFATVDDVRRQQALLRSKRISEMLAFNPRGKRPRSSPTDPNWPSMPDRTDGYNELERVYKQVYEPQIVEIVNDQFPATFSVVDDTVHASPTPDLTLDAVEDTNERWQSTGGSSPAFVGAQRVLRTTNKRIAGAPNTMTTKIDGRFKPATSYWLPCLETLRVTLEASVTVHNPCGVALQGTPNLPCATPPTHLEGRLNFFRPNGQAVFVFPATFQCSGSPQQEISQPDNLFYAFWAPRTHPDDINQIVKVMNPCLPADHPTNLLTGSYNVIMRRTFDINLSRADLDSLLHPNGTYRFSLLVRAVAHNGLDFGEDAMLTVDWNLIQFTRIDRPGVTMQDCGNSLPGGGGEPMAMVAGSTMMGAMEGVSSDVNLDAVTSPADITEFLNAQQYALPTGDYNRDGAHDDVDLVEFLADYATND